MAKHATDLVVGGYALAFRLVGFPSSTLRVRVREIQHGRYAIVHTADLLDAGTMLLLDIDKLEALEENPAGGWSLVVDDPARVPMYDVERALTRPVPEARPA